jgi:glycosyltransferase involved in cell wall biosynthesis
MTSIIVRNTGKFAVSIPGYVISPGEIRKLPRGFIGFVQSHNSLELVSEGEAPKIVHSMRNRNINGVDTTENYIDGYNVSIRCDAPPIIEPSISIIVLTMLLEDRQYPITTMCLDSIVKNTKCDYELIIVDNASTNERWLKRLDNIDCIKYLSEKNLGIPKGRNLGASFANKEYIVFLDDDVFVQPDWYKYLINPFTIFDDVGVSGFFKGSFKPNLDLSEHKCDWSNKYVYVGGGGTAFKLETFNKIGKLDEAYTPFLCEDPDICFRMNKHHYRIASIDNDIMIHSGHATTNVCPERHTAANRSLKIFKSRWSHRQNKGISFITLFHEKSKYLDEAINSVKDIPNSELIIVGDGNDPPKYDNVLNTRIENRKGIAFSRNEGIRLANKDYIMFIDQDDIIVGDHLAEIVEILNMRQDIDAIFGEIKLLENNTLRKHSYNPWSFEESNKHNCVPMSGTIMRTSLFDTFGWFNPALTACEDWYFWNMIAAKGAHIEKCSATVAHIRQHPEQMTRWNGKANEVIGNKIRELFKFFDNYKFSRRTIVANTSIPYYSGLITPVESKDAKIDIIATMHTLN